MIRQPGMKPRLESRNKPGRSFRRERSPVAPKSVITCGYLGPTPEGILVTAQILTPTTTTVKTRTQPRAESNQRQLRNLPRPGAVSNAGGQGGLSDVGRMERLIANQPPQHAIGPKGAQGHG